jgi:hypothetical protein
VFRQWPHDKQLIRQPQLHPHDQRHRIQIASRATWRTSIPRALLAHPCRHP